MQNRFKAGNLLVETGIELLDERINRLELSQLTVRDRVGQTDKIVATGKDVRLRRKRI